MYTKYSLKYSFPFVNRFILALFHNLSQRILCKLKGPVSGKNVRFRTEVPDEFNKKRAFFELYTGLCLNCTNHTRTRIALQKYTKQNLCRMLNPREMLTEITVADTHNECMKRKSLYKANGAFMHIFVNTAQRILFFCTIQSAKHRFLSSGAFFP